MSAPRSPLPISPAVSRLTARHHFAGDDVSLQTGENTGRFLAGGTAARRGGGQPDGGGTGRGSGGSPTVGARPHYSRHGATRGAGRAPIRVGRDARGHGPLAAATAVMTPALARGGDAGVISEANAGRPRPGEQPAPGGGRRFSPSFSWQLTPLPPPPPPPPPVDQVDTDRRPSFSNCRRPLGTSARRQQPRPVRAAPRPEGIAAKSAY